MAETMQKWFETIVKRLTTGGACDAFVFSLTYMYLTLDPYAYFLRSHRRKNKKTPAGDGAPAGVAGKNCALQR